MSSTETYYYFQLSLVLIFVLLKDIIFLVGWWTRIHWYHLPNGCHRQYRSNKNLYRESNSWLVDYSEWKYTQIISLRFKEIIVIVHLTKSYNQRFAKKNFFEGTLRNTVKNKSNTKR